MKHRAASWTARALLGVTVAGVMLVAWLESRLSTPLAFLWWLLDFSLALLVTVTVGALIVVRRPRNTVGWILIAAGVAFVVTETAASYADYGYRTPASPPVGAVWAAWVGTWLWSLPFLLFFVFLPLVFPDGRLPSLRWRPVAWLAAAMPVIQIPALALMPGPMSPSDHGATWPNPIGVEGASPVLEGISNAVAVLFLAALAAAVTAVVVRYRGAHGEQRQQLKWLLFAVASVALYFPLNTIPYLLPVLDPLAGLVFSLMPVAIGMAVLRYRLYEIDRVISRTLSYGLLTGILGLVYAGGVVVLGGLLRPVAGDSQLVVAGSTLLVAALFGPLRRRVQAAVDHRFNRARYDAARTVEAFRGRLRDDVDLDQLSHELLQTVRSTVEPAQASLWLRTGQGRAGP